MTLSVEAGNLPGYIFLPAGSEPADFGPSGRPYRPERLVTLPRLQRKLRDNRGLIRFRRGSLQFLFLPAVVVTLARDLNGREKLQADTRASRQAARSAFWSELVPGVMPLGRFGTVRRRYRTVGIDDFAHVSALLEARLRVALHYPRGSMLSAIAGRRLFHTLDHQERRILEGALGDAQVPVTSMHGDLHHFNFVVDGDSLRLIDWEHFDPEGSFLFDYLNFHVNVGHTNGGGGHWSRTLSMITPEDAAFGAVARQSGIEPNMLLAYYLFMKIDSIISGRPRARSEIDRLHLCMREAICSLQDTVPRTRAIAAAGR